MNSAQDLVKVVVGYLKVLFQNLCGETSENSKSECLVYESRFENETFPKRSIIDNEILAYMTQSSVRFGSFALET
jgi:hypothetical protein